MSGPATPASLKGVPCSRCGSVRAIRWGANGVVTCLVVAACDARARKWTVHNSSALDRQVTLTELKDMIKNSPNIGFQAGSLKTGWMFFISQSGRGWSLAVKEK